MTTRTKSVSKKRSDRQEHDAYETPPELCSAVCSTLAAAALNPKSVLEPGAGSGNFVRAVRAQWPTAFIEAVEIRSKIDELLGSGANSAFIADYLVEGATHKLYDLIIGNPPYGGGLAEKFVEKSVSLLAPHGVLAFILKTHFFNTAKRIDMWRRFPFYVSFPITPRPDFTGEGRDTSEYTLICWRRVRLGEAGSLPAAQGVSLHGDCQLAVASPIVWKQGRSK